jgi:hypothetical protein
MLDLFISWNIFNWKSHVEVFAFGSVVIIFLLTGIIFSSIVDIFVSSSICFLPDGTNFLSVGIVLFS